MGSDPIVFKLHHLWENETVIAYFLQDERYD